jgi:hypothetical protein
MKYCLLGVLAAAMTLPAATITFHCLEPVNYINCSDVAFKLYADVNDLGGGQVEFVFRNEALESSTMTQINWDDSSGLLAAFDSITNGTGVLMVIQDPVGPVNGGGSVFQLVMYQAEKDGAVANGIDPGEWMKATFTLTAGFTYDDLLAAYGDGGLNRLGMHVQQLGPGQSASDFVISDPLETAPPPAPEIPEPSTALLVGIGLFLCCISKRR